MRIAITGGTGFVGTHLTQRLLDTGHACVLVARGEGGVEAGVRDHENTEFVSASVSTSEALRDAFSGCDAVAHLAGINMERGSQTYDAVHVQGTRNAVEAAESAGAGKVILSSFLRARPDCGSSYHESKWRAEEIIRSSGLDYTVFKPGVVYGSGDHMLDHLTRWLSTTRLIGLVGFKEKRFRPLAVEDLVDLMTASLLDDRLSRKTVPVLGPEELTLEEGIQRVGRAIDREPIVVPLPVHVQRGLAWLQEKTMRTPIASRAQVRMLAEGITEPLPKEPLDALPEDLEPTLQFTQERINEGVPEERRYGPKDLRW